MKPLEFLFALLKQFINFEPGRLSELSEKAHAWWNIQVDKDNAASKFLKKGDEWYVQIILAIAFLFGVKYVSGWLTRNDSPNMLDDDDYDDYDDEEPVHSGRGKFNLAK